MKKKNLFLLLIMALIVIPANVKAFTVDAAGVCNVADGVQANGTATQICYTGTQREITFITSNETPSQKYFCLQETKDLNAATYNDTPIATFHNRGYACAVYELLNDGTITVDNLKTAIGGTSGTINFDVTASNPTFNTLSSVTAGSAADTYIKIQQKIWNVNENTTCTVPYTTPSTVPSIGSNLAATALTKDSETDTYMYSKITVTKNSAVPSYDVTLVNAPAGTKLSSTKNVSNEITATGITANEFYVLIPATVENVNVTVKASYNYTSKSVTDVTVTEYKSGVTANQTLGKLSATITETAKTTSGQIKLQTNPSIDFKVCKTDSKTHNPMAGVKFSITSADASTTFELTTGADGCATKENVKQAKYTITEVTAPKGYKKLSPKSVDCTTTPLGNICIAEVENTPITLKVKKLDESNQPLVDAKMEIIYLDGTPTGRVIDTWTTVLEDHVVNVENLEFGKYILREEEAPDGYVISTEIEFEINADNYVIGNETKQYGDDALVTVTMIDDVTKVSILKVNADTGEPLVGAVLRVEKEDGTVVVDDWTTDGTPKVIKKLPHGTYYLVEVSAPEGYILQTERQPFTISQTSKDEEVIIKNVPSTASTKSALLISFAMLDIALGISIILYVRKRKATE